MGATRIPDDGPPRTTAEVAAEFRAAGLTPRSWSNAPGDVYGSHEHDYHKRLVCVQGGITFHTPHGDVVLAAGDRLELEPHTAHSATVGPEGVTCVEAPVR
jgi:quercetin dioxygenase-like cupin family protein